MEKRKVIVFSTRGNNLQQFETAAVTLGDLIAETGISLDGVKATESVNKTTLDNFEAVLPAGDFKLYLRPEKTKAGSDFKNMSFADLKSYIVNTPGAKDYLNAEAKKLGKNWTQLTTEQRVKFLEKFNKTSVDKPSVDKIAADIKAKETAPKKQPKVENNVKEGVQSTTAPEKDSWSRMFDLLGEIKNMLETVLGAGTCSKATPVSVEPKTNVLVETEEEKAHRLLLEECRMEAAKLDGSTI